MNSCEYSYSDVALALCTMAHHFLPVRILPHLTSFYTFKVMYISKRESCVFDPRRRRVMAVTASFHTRSLEWPGSAELVFLLCCLVILGGAELSFSFPVPLEMQPSLLTGEQAPADRKSFRVRTHAAICQHGRLPMVFSSCKEFIFPGWHCCATQVACDIVGSSSREASLWRGTSGVLGVPIDICGVWVMQKKKKFHVAPIVGSLWSIGCVNVRVYCRPLKRSRIASAPEGLAAC